MLRSSHVSVYLPRRILGCGTRDLGGRNCFVSSFKQSKVIEMFAFLQNLMRRLDICESVRDTSKSGKNCDGGS